MFARRHPIFLTAATVVLCTAAGPASKPATKAPTAPTKMDDTRLSTLIKRLDPKAIIRNNVRQLTVEGHKIMVVSDANADRMRIMTAVTAAADLEPAMLKRMLQANFDAVLDARYAIAQDIVWSAFIHPLSPLTDEQFYSGLAQVVVAAETFGSTFTSGALVFRGGDSEGLHQQLYQRILKKGQIKI